MQVQLEVSHVRSQRKTWSASPGSANSTQARGKSRGTSGTSPPYGRLARRNARTLAMAPRSAKMGTMRLAVLDVGSNTVHLLVVDAYPGARPLPAYSHKAELRLPHALADGRGGHAGGGG